MNVARRTPTPSRSRLMLYGAITVAFFTIIIAAGLTLWNLRQIQEMRRLRQMLFLRLNTLTLGGQLEFLNLSEQDRNARRDYMRTVYLHPESIDIDAISYNLLCRPAPFVGYLPEPGQQPEGAFNPQQLRGNKPVMLPKPPGVYRIFVSGGSLVYGAAAPDDNTTISAYLERILNEMAPLPGKTIEVFNAGMPGWASAHERINIENRLSAWEPDLVVMLTGGNDGHWGFLGHDIMSFRAPEEQLYFELINSSLLRAQMRPYPPAPPAPGAEPVAPELVAARFMKNLRLAAFATRETHARLAVALQPILSPRFKPPAAGEAWWLEHIEPDGKLEYLEACYERMQSALDELPQGGYGDPALVPLRLLDVFAEQREPIYLDLFHMGDKGNEILARALARKLIPMIGEIP